MKKIKDIEEIDDAKILIDTGDKLPDDITVKNALIRVLLKMVISVIHNYF